ncbi:MULTISPECIES: dihydrodipicolinate synthase family protein [unclassified Cohnella]|uniref:dihydrodipicolinate synthase family protein n=1 Tax=unclassified Cohnella TaxID=2636738 RepID=UPI00117E3154|nr:MULTISPECIES: dihydrodipicolinate synthase family protein [unclassified Cohnella]
MGRRLFSLPIIRSPKTLAIRILVIVALILAGASGGAAAYLFVKSSDLAEANDAQAALIEEQAKKIEGLSAKISKYDKRISEISTIKELANNLNTDNNVYVTIKNYEIGNTTSGQFKLVGER